jgi:hypothetical protein
MEVLLERLHLAGQLAAVRYLTEGGPQATGGIYKTQTGNGVQRGTRGARVLNVSE